MTGSLLHGRYLLANDAGDASRAGHDRLLDRDVEVVLLDPVADAAERAAFIRALRRGSTDAPPAVCPVLDVGSEGTRPYLVVPRTTQRLDELLQHPVAGAVQAQVARDVVTGVLALADRQLRPQSLRAADLRLDETGRVQILPTAAVSSLRERLTLPPTPGLTAAMLAAVREEVRQFVQHLLSAGTHSAPESVVAFAREPAGTPLSDLEPALDAWLEQEVVGGSRRDAAPSVVPSRDGGRRFVVGAATPAPRPPATPPDTMLPAPADDSAEADLDLRTRRIVSRVTTVVGLVLFISVTALALVTLLSPF